METNLKNHWEEVYATKQPHQVSWTQEMPIHSIDFFESFHLPLSAKIIDVGGGDSKFVDYLLNRGYTNITVLDISEKAIERAKIRLGEKGLNVNWIISDINDYQPKETFDFWHDRAAFHFLTKTKEISLYVQTVSSVAKNILVGTFSVDGPFKCSGLEVKQYDQNSMKNLFENAGFKNITCKNVDHITPSQVTQKFTFCSFTNQI